MVKRVYAHIHTRARGQVVTHAHSTKHIHDIYASVVGLHALLSLLEFVAVRVVMIVG